MEPGSPYIQTEYAGDHLVDLCSMPLAGYASVSRAGTSNAITNVLPRTRSAEHPESPWNPRRSDLERRSVASLCLTPGFCGAARLRERSAAALN